MGVVSMSMEVMDVVTMEVMVHNAVDSPPPPPFFLRNVNGITCN